MSQTANVEAWLRQRQGRGGGSRGITRTERGGPLPMSFGQEQMWFLDQLVPDSAEYLVPLAFRLRGAVDRKALAGAWDALVERHEILRTRHVLDDGEPRQVVDDAVAGGLAVVSVADAPAHEREQRVAELVATGASTPFDLARQWPVRATLVEVGAAEHVLPVGELPLADLGAEPGPLPGGEVRVLDGELGERGVGAPLGGDVQRPQVGHGEAGGPGVAGDVVEHHQQHVLGRA
ncbi:hypothetical protein K7G98_22690, partial [Saccharothrix sp. MB29]|nr:hypothetical protein [Saccharothrix sp. MB29]